MKAARLSIIILAVFTSVAAVAATLSKEAQFVAAARKAFETHDAAALVALSCWDRVPDRLKESGKQLYARDVANAVTDIKLIDPDPNFPDLDWTEAGVTYHSNLAVTKQLKITFAAGSMFRDATYPVGERDGKLFLLEPAPVK